MTFRLWTQRGGEPAMRPLETLPEAEAALWTDRTPPGRLGATGSRNGEGRLGWVDLPLAAAGDLPDYVRLREELLAEGFERLLVVAIGGAMLGGQSLVSGLPQRTGPQAGLEIGFLDGLSPERIRNAVRPDRLPGTVFLVASKSGATVETRALEAVIFRSLQEAGAAPGRQLLAVSDAGTPLYRWADTAGYRRRFAGKADVGGRFSALSVFGLLPAALAGCELEAQLAAVRAVREGLDGDAPQAADPAFRLGALLARLHGEGRFQAHLTASAEWRGLLPWLEQLFAESTGKEGRGILPVVCRPPYPARLGPTNFVVHLGSAEDDDRARFQEAARAGVPVIECPLADAGLLPAMFRWQIAVAVAGFRMGVDPYDQPDVDQTKAAARELAADPGSAPRPLPVSDSDLGEFLAQAGEGGLVINAFGHRSRTAEALLHGLQRQFATQFGVTPALGFGSGLLHSLGQIEKGGPPGLAVLMLTWSGLEEVFLPASPELPTALVGLGAGAFARLQAAADYEELRRRGRRVCWLDASFPGEAGLAELVGRLGSAGHG